MWRSRAKYLDRVGEGLDRAYAEAEVETHRFDNTRMVIFSDLHRGTGDRADDFRPCRKIYHAALGYYGSLDFRLFLLGDIEELWERLIGTIVGQYESTLKLEKQFFDRGAAVRFVGNHDESLAWPWNRSVIERFINGQPLREGLIIRLVDSADRPIGELFFVHGHQGIHYSWFDRFVVKRLWAPIQRLSGITVGMPSSDHSIRLLHEQALYEWARQRKDLLLVCGHTHHPVFMSTAWEQTVRDELEALRATDASREAIAMKEAQLNWVAADLDEMKSALPEDARPCYFNTGCCSFQDGSITGIEIVDGRIRLVRWSGESGSPRRQALREADLANILGRCQNGVCSLQGPDASSAEELG
ncbi:MAG: metallophosphoesterase [Verrucomicrobiae bacterium]|nr:metallophosphoesterase [Verrucomicrobiae bacterium]